MTDEEKQPIEPPKKESFITRMQRQGKLVIQPPEPGKLDVLKKIKELKDEIGT